MLQSGQFDLSAGEVERLAAQVEAHPTGDIPYSDWIAALIDWRAVQVRRASVKGQDHTHTEMLNMVCHRGQVLPMERKPGEVHLHMAAGPRIDSSQGNTQLRTAGCQCGPNLIETTNDALNLLIPVCETDSE